MEVDGEAAEVEPGDAIAIPPGAWHAGPAHRHPLAALPLLLRPPYRHEDTYFA